MDVTKALYLGIFDTLVFICTLLSFYCIFYTNLQSLLKTEKIFSIQLVKVNDASHTYRLCEFCIRPMAT